MRVEEIAEQDVFVNVAGGIRIVEPASDLATAVAIASNFREQAVEPTTILMGEVGLAGEIRAVSQIEKRLKEAARQGLTLVTYDCRTIPPLLKTWGESGRDHGGVIFVDEKSISPADIGGLVRALNMLIREQGKMDWKNRVCFLRL